MSGWGGYFKPAEYGPIVNPAAGPWRTLLTPGQLAPQDLQANEVLHFLRHDLVLGRVFGARFDRVPWLVTPRTEFPRLAVYNVSALPSERPTNTSLERSSVFVATLWDLAAVEPLADGEASVATVMAQVKRVLRAAKNRVLTVWWADSETALAENDMAFGGEQYGDVSGVVDREVRPIGVVHQLEVIHTLKVDKNTGQFTRLGSPPT